MSEDNVVHLFDARSAYPSAAGDSVSDVQDIMARWEDSAAKVTKRQWDDVTARAVARKAVADNLRAGLMNHAATLRSDPARNHIEETPTVKITKRTIDRAITVVAAGAAPLLAILIRHHVITAADATDLGGGLTAAVVAYHGGASVQRKRTTPSVRDIETP